MRNKNITVIELFIASSAETKDIRDKIVIGLKELSRQHENAGFCFQVQWWEDESASITPSGQSQPEYDKLIDKSDMVAVIIKNFLGKYTEDEFNYAFNLLKEKGNSPKTVVYTLPNNKDDDSRYKFIKSLRSNGLDYFHCIVDNEHHLIDKIKGELIRIKNDYEAELKTSATDVQETVTRLHLDGELTKEAVSLFEKGDYSGASQALDMDIIRERAGKLTAGQKEVAEAFILKAKLELTNVKNKERFSIAESLFNEALSASRAPEILFEYAYYCQNQNMFEKAMQFYTETLEILRKLAADNPAAYNPYVAITLNNLANLYSNTNDYERAEREYTEALELYRKLASDNPAAYNSDVAMTLNNLAILHKNTNDYEQAEKEYTEALKLYRKLASDNPAAYNSDVAMTLNNLAVLHSDSSDYERSEKEYTEALEIRRKLAADNPAAYNPDVAGTLNNLAVLHSDSSDYERSEKEYTEALEIRRKLASDNPAAYNPDVAMTLNNLAVLHSDTNDYERAEKEYTEALELYRKLASDNPAAYNPDVAMTLNNLAILHSVTKNYERAEKEYNEALELITTFYNSYPNVYQKHYDKIKEGLKQLEKDLILN